MADSGLGIAAPDLQEVLDGLAETQKRFRKELNDEHKEIARFVAARIARQAKATPGLRRYAEAWRPSGVRAGARLTLRRGPGMEGAKAAYLGMRPLTRTGWNAATYRNGVRLSGRRYIPPDRPQARPWIGTNWIVGQPGEGPYGVRNVAPKITDEVTERLQAAFMRAANKVWKG